MSFLLRHIARYAAQKLASDPRAREKAARVAPRYREPEAWLIDHGLGQYVASRPKGTGFRHSLV